MNHIEYNNRIYPTTYNASNRDAFSNHVSVTMDNGYLYIGDDHISLEELAYEAV